MANYGALTREDANHQRVVRVEVRIGDYASDSSSARGDGSLQLAPEDNDPAALKYALWTATDEAYKNALRAYAAKQAALKQFQTPPTANDFTPAKAHHGDRAARRTGHRSRRVEASHRRSQRPLRFVTGDALLRQHRAGLHRQRQRGCRQSLHRHPPMARSCATATREYSDSISIAGQAADGMELQRANGSTATTARGP